MNEYAIKQAKGDFYSYRANELGVDVSEVKEMLGCTLDCWTSNVDDEIEVKNLKMKVLSEDRLDSECEAWIDLEVELTSKINGESLLVKKTWEKDFDDDEYIFTGFNL